MSAGLGLLTHDKMKIFGIGEWLQKIECQYRTTVSDHFGLSLSHKWVIQEENIYNIILRHISPSRCQLSNEYLEIPPSYCRLYHQLHIADSLLILNDYVYILICVEFIGKGLILQLCKQAGMNVINLKIINLQKQHGHWHGLVWRLDFAIILYPSLQTMSS